MKCEMELKSPVIEFPFNFVRIHFFLDFKYKKFA